MTIRAVLAASFLMLAPLNPAPATAQSANDDAWVACFLGCQSSGYYTNDYCTINCNRLYGQPDQTGGGDPNHIPLPTPRPPICPDCKDK